MKATDNQDVKEIDEANWVKCTAMIKGNIMNDLNNLTYTRHHKKCNSPNHFELTSS